MFDNPSIGSGVAASGAIGSAAPNRRQSAAGSTRSTARDSTRDSAGDFPGDFPGDSAVLAIAGSTPVPGAPTVDPLSLPPGPELASTLTHMDPRALDLGDRLELLRAWARLESWVAAGKMRAIVQVAALGLTDVGGGDGRKQVLDSGPELVATALRLSPRAAQSELGWARLLTGSRQATFAALAVGAISARSARVVCDETLELDDELISQVETRILDRAQHQTPQQLRRSLRRAIAVLAPGHETARCHQERTRRCVRLTPALHGMAILEAYLPAEQAYSAYAVLTQAARRARDRDHEACADSGVDRTDSDSDSDTLDAYRADLFVTAVAKVAAQLEAAGADPDQWQAQVVVDLATALGLADNPGEIRGYGPIPAELARRLAADATWTRWLIEPATGALLDVGRKRYVPSARLRQFIHARDRVCRFPGCEQPAHRCDLDHAEPWDVGGETTTANLGALCRRHHRIKTHCEWEITESQADGACTWRTPTGHKIDVVPEPVLPVMPARQAAPLTVMQTPPVTAAPPTLTPCPAPTRVQSGDAQCGTESAAQPGAVGCADPPRRTGRADRSRLAASAARDRFDDPGDDPPF